MAAYFVMNGGANPYHHRSKVLRTTIKVARGVQTCSINASAFLGMATGRGACNESWGLFRARMRG